MAEQLPNSRNAPAPLIWRVPSWQTAALILVLCVIAGWNIYGHPSATGRTLTLVFAAAVLAAVISALRMYTLVDDEGVTVRMVGKPDWAGWDEIERVEVAGGIRGSNSIRIVRHDSTYIDIPPSLVLPTLPTGRPRAWAMLNARVREIEERRPAGTGTAQD